MNKFEKHDIENIIYAKEILQEKRKELLNLYTDSYGILNRRKIERKMNNATYIFDSLPTETEFFLDRNISSYNNSLEYEMIKEEAKDYKELRKRMQKELETEQIKLLKEFFSKKEKIKEEDLKKLLSLKFQSYSSESYRMLLSSNIDLATKLEIRKMRENYIKECDKANVYPVVNPKKIDLMIYRLNELKEIMTYEIISKSKFIQRKKQEIFDKSGIIITNEEFVKMFENENALAVQIPHLDKKTGKLHQILHCPIFSIANISPDTIDQIFLHENRHLVESQYKIIDYYLANRYIVFTEIRTEKNAINDLEKIDSIFYRTNESGLKSAYEDLFPLCGDLFEKHITKFNRWFINNNIAAMEKKLGSDILEYADMLTETLETVMAPGNSRVSENVAINPTSYLEKVEKINSKIKKKAFLQ